MTSATVPVGPDALALRPMTAAELAGYLEDTVIQYARQRSEYGGEDPHVAARVARLQTDAMFPGGRPGPGHQVFAVTESATGERVGWLWLELREPSDRTGEGTRVFVYDVEVEEGRRGQGLGRGLMLLVERWAAQHGARRVALNVFGGNAVARRLYASLGYAEEAVFMGKEIG